MKNVWMMSVVGLVVVAFSAPAFAGCFEDVEVSSFMVEVTPETECLTFDLAGNECVGGAELLITNNCADDLVITLPRDMEPSFTQTIAAGAEGGTRIDREANTTTWEREATLGGQELTITVEYESRVTNTYDDTCSAAGSAAVAPFALLGFLGLRRRRRA